MSDTRRTSDCQCHEILLGAHRLTISCQHGFTREDMEREFGAKVGEPHPLWEQLRGQTGTICPVHGPVNYVSDVMEWVRREPVSDW